MKVDFTAKKDRERLELERTGGVALPTNMIYPPNYPAEPAIKLTSVLTYSEVNRVLDRMEEIIDSEKQADSKEQ